MTERGMVTGIEGAVVTVSLRMMEGCASCVNSSCKTNRGGIKAYNEKGIAVSEGDTVEIVIAGRSQLDGALWVLGMPLAVFMIAYFAGRALFPGAGEGPAVALSVGGLALGMLAGMLIQKGRRLDSLPKVTRKVTFEELEPGCGARGGEEFTGEQEPGVG